jgi:hypothetical protein
MSAWTSALPFFPARELACRHCGVIKLDTDFAAMLTALRSTWGSPLMPTSVCRCHAHNKSVGGHPNSLHLTENAKWKTFGTMAADIRWSKWDTEEKLRFARHAHKMGFRVGLHDIFCHIDLGRKLGINPRPFVYGAWANEFTADEVILC